MLSFEEVWEDRPKSLFMMVFSIVVIVIGFVLFDHFKQETQRYEALSIIYLLSNHADVDKTQYQILQVNFLINPKVKEIIDDVREVDPKGFAFVTIAEAVKNANYDVAESKNLVKDMLAPVVGTEHFPDSGVIEYKIAENQENQLIWVMGGFGILGFLIAAYYGFKDKTYVKLDQNFWG